jgi:hypothetical protein
MPTIYFAYSDTAIFPTTGDGAPVSHDVAIADDTGYIRIKQDHMLDDRQEDPDDLGVKLSLFVWFDGTFLGVAANKQWLAKFLTARYRWISMGLNGTTPLGAFADTTMSTSDSSYGYVLCDCTTDQARASLDYALKNGYEFISRKIYPALLLR